MTLLEISLKTLRWTSTFQTERSVWYFKWKNLWWQRSKTIVQLKCSSKKSFSFDLKKKMCYRMIDTCFYQNTALRSSFLCRSNIHQWSRCLHWSSQEHQKYLNGFSNITFPSASTSWNSDDGSRSNGERLECWEGPDSTRWKIIFRWFWLILSLVEN